MTARPWMPMYWGDYLADTGHLSTLEHGAYMLLMGHYWLNDGLPDDDAKLARIARLTPAQWRKVKPTIQEFFADGWKHKRIEFELTESERISHAGRTGGLASGESRRKAKAEQNQQQERTVVHQSLNDQATKREALQPQPHSQEERKERAEARDPRSELFDRGLEILRRITGRTPNSCRSLIGRWLKSIDDEAIHVLAAIEDAEKQRVADPTSWITASLTRRNGAANASPRPKSEWSTALDKLGEYARSGDEGSRGGSGTAVQVLLPSGRSAG